MVIEKINAKEEKMFVIFMKVHSSKFTCYRAYKHLNSIIKDAMLVSFFPQKTSFFKLHLIQKKLYSSSSILNSFDKPNIWLLLFVDDTLIYIIEILFFSFKKTVDIMLIKLWKILFKILWYPYKEKNETRLQKLMWNWNEKKKNSKENF